MGGARKEGRLVVRTNREGRIPESHLQRAGSCLSLSLRTGGQEEGKGPMEGSAISPWHLIKGMKAGEAKPTGSPPGSKPSSYLKHPQQSSKQLHFPVLGVFGPAASGVFLG